MSLVKVQRVAYDCIRGVPSELRSGRYVGMARLTGCAMPPHNRTGKR
jgi:hypothetical protein